MTANPDEDRPLIEAAQADPARFVELYERYVDRIYAFVSRRTHDRAAAEDVTSEVFERALAHLGGFEWRGLPFAAWLFRIASNAIADKGRQDARISDDPLADIPDTRELEAIERRVILFELVDRLPDLQRQVIRMRFVEEKSIRRNRRGPGPVRRCRQAAAASGAREPEKGMGSP